MMSPNELAATASAIAFALGNELSIEDALTLSAVLKQILSIRESNAIWFIQANVPQFRVKMLANPSGLPSTL